MTDTEEALMEENSSDKLEALLGLQVSVGEPAIFVELLVLYLLLLENLQPHGSSGVELRILAVMFFFEKKRRRAKLASKHQITWL